jgi:hypothetical protein
VRNTSAVHATAAREAGLGPAAKTRTGKARRLLTIPGVIGAGYTLSWIAGLTVPAPSPEMRASGPAIVAALRDHGPAMATQFTLTEGLPAIGIAVVSAALARTARRHGAPLTARFALASGLTAAVISALQFILGLVLAATSAPGLAHALYQSLDRMDGVKMLALAVLGAAGAATTALPRWLRWTGAALAVAITCSGLVYLLLLPSLAAAAGPALVLLLAFITGCGIMIGMRDSSAVKDS